MIPAVSRTAALLLSLLVGGLLGTGCTSDEASSRAQPDSAAAPSTPRPPVHNTAAGTPPAAPPAALPDTDRSLAQRLADASIAARAKQALVRVRSLRRFHFAPRAVQGRLMLRGTVDTRAQSRRAERVVRGVPGMTAVTNRLTIKERAANADAAPRDRSTYHTVRRGDTLSEIAREHDTSVRRLRALNTLSATLQPGQRIRVR